MGKMLVSSAGLSGMGVGKEGRSTGLSAYRNDDFMGVDWELLAFYAGILWDLPAFYGIEWLCMALWGVYGCIYIYIYILYYILFGRPGLGLSIFGYHHGFNNLHKLI